MGPHRIWIYGHFRGGLNPLKTYNPYELAVIACIRNRLVKLDESGRMVGQLARSWQILDGGKTYEFVLDRTFGIGAAEVKSALDLAISSNSKIFHKRLMQSILDRDWFVLTGVDRFKIRLRKPYPAFLYLLTSPEFSVAVKSIDKKRLKIKIPNRSLEVMDKNSNQINIEVSNDLKTIEQALKTHKVDLVLGLPIQVAEKLELPEGFNLEVGRFANPLFIQLNERKSILQNKRFREILFSIFVDEARGWSKKKKFLKFHPHFIPPGLLRPQYYGNDNLKIEGGGSQYSDSVNLWFDSAYLDGEFFQRVKKKAANAGIKINLVSRPFQDVAKKLYDFDLALSDSGSFFPDPDSMLSIWPRALPSFPFPGEDLLTKINQARSIANASERLKKYEEAILDFEKERWVIPLFVGYDSVIIRKGISLLGDMSSPFDLICNDQHETN